MQYFGYVWGIMCRLKRAVFAANPRFLMLKKEVQSVVHDYLVTQPEVLIEATRPYKKTAATHARRSSKSC